MHAIRFKVFFPDGTNIEATGDDNNPLDVSVDKDGALRYTQKATVQEFRGMPFTIVWKKIDPTRVDW